MANQLDLASQQFIGYYHGKWGDLIGLIIAMGLTKNEWEKIKINYSLNLDESDMIEINEHFE